MARIRIRRVVMTIPVEFLPPFCYARIVRRSLEHCTEGVLDATFVGVVGHHMLVRPVGDVATTALVFEFAYRLSHIRQIPFDWNVVLTCHQRAIVATLKQQLAGHGANWLKVPR